MKKLKKLIILAILGLSIISVASYANADKGGKILNKVLHKAGGCSIPATRIAMAHSMEEWKKFYESGQMEAEIQKLCPKMGQLPKIENKKYANDVFSFLEHYSNDSGAIPA